MKKIYTLSAIILAALISFVACNKETVDQEISQNSTVVLTVNAVSPATKTVFGEKTSSGYPIIWAETGEQIELVEILTPANGDDASYKGYPSTSYTLSDANTSAQFSAEVDALTTEGTYDYHFLYPQSAYKSANTKYKDLYAIIPDTQTPTAASPDAAATLLYAGSTDHENQPTEALDINFSHITAYGKMTIKNASTAFAASSETISSVSISVPAGGIYYYWEDGHIAPVSTTAKDAVTIKTDNLETSGDFVAWFACAPYSLKVGDKLTVSVTTNANTYIRVITMTKAMTFESGKVSKFSVDMSSAGEAADLSGDYLIVSTDGANPWYVMTYDTSKGTFYLGEPTDVAAATEIDTDDASTNFEEYCIDPYVWKLAKVSGGYSLQNANTKKYVSWSSGNSATAVDAAATLVVADEGAGVFKVKHTSDESRVLQYVYNNGTNPRFAFYTTSQKSLTFIPVASYKLKLATPIITNASASGSTISVTWNEVANASSYLVTCTGQTDKSIPYGTTSASFTGLSDGDYTITVKAVGSGNYVSSDAATESVTIGSGIRFSWTRSGTTDTVTDGYALNKTATAKEGYYQDASSGLFLTLTKSDETAIFSSSPTSITLKATVGGGSTKDPLANNVIAYLVDADGKKIDATETTVTTKVESTNGKEYTVTIPNVSEAYGVCVAHTKESGYNTRLFSISVSID